LYQVKAVLVSRIFERGELDKEQNKPFQHIFFFVMSLSTQDHGDPNFQCLLWTLCASRVPGTPVREPGGVRESGHWLDKLWKNGARRRATFISYTVTLEDNTAVFGEGFLSQYLCIIEAAVAQIMTPAKRYQLSQIPLHIKEQFGQFCFTTIGQGPCVCVA
jgi:hypothetical protein